MREYESHRKRASISGSMSFLIYTSTHQFIRLESKVYFNYHASTIHWQQPIIIQSILRVLPCLVLLDEFLFLDSVILLVNPCPMGSKVQKPQPSTGDQAASNARLAVDRTLLVGVGNCTLTVVLGDVAGPSSSNSSSSATRRIFSLQAQTLANIAM